MTSEFGELNSDIPIHSHVRDATGVGRVIMRKDGQYAGEPIAKIFATGVFPTMTEAEKRQALDLELELATVVCDYLEGKRRESKT